VVIATYNDDPLTDCKTEILERWVWSWEKAKGMAGMVGTLCCSVVKTSMRASFRSPEALALALRKSVRGSRRGVGVV